MKLVVLSDSHGRADLIRAVLERHKDAEAVLFLGDGLRDLSRLTDLPPNLTPIAVRGNCDLLMGWGQEEPPTERMVAFDRFKILMMHGHTRGVKHGMETAAEAAASRGADLLLYGHTHAAREAYLPEGERVGGGILTKPLWLFNPGSLGESGTGRPSYGLVTIQQGQLLLSHGSL